MAREVKMPYDFVTGEPINIEKLKAFEALVRADEREQIIAANAPVIERVNAHIKELEQALAAQPAPVKVWEAEGYDALMQEMQMVKARNIRQHAEIERLKAAQPAVPDAIGPNEDELPAYAAGWNDCRALMLEMRKP
jgi:hypothetical protein